MNTRPVIRTIEKKNETATRPLLWTTKMTIIGEALDRLEAAQARRVYKFRESKADEVARFRAIDAEIAEAEAKIAWAEACPTLEA